MPVRCSTSARSGSLRQGRFGANSTVERAASMNPAAPSPAPPTSCSVASSVMTAAIVSTVAGPSPGGVSRRTRARILPASFTTPAAILVPPMSTPMVSPMNPPRPDAGDLPPPGGRYRVSILPRRPRRGRLR
jgi:hypothetical protein